MAVLGNYFGTDWVTGSTLDLQMSTDGKNWSDAGHATVLSISNYSTQAKVTADPDSPIVMVLTLLDADPNADAGRAQIVNGSSSVFCDYEVSSLESGGTLTLFAIPYVTVMYNWTITQVDETGTPTAGGNITLFHATAPQTGHEIWYRAL